MAMPLIFSFPLTSKGKIIVPSWVNIFAIIRAIDTRNIMKTQIFAVLKREVAKDWLRSRALDLNEAGVEFFREASSELSALSARCCISRINLFAAPFCTPMVFSSIFSSSSGSRYGIGHQLSVFYNSLNYRLLFPLSGSRMIVFPTLKLSSALPILVYHHQARTGRSG